MALLTAHQLVKSYGLQPILQNITFSVNPGERVGLIGPNGAGKSTLLHLLTGQEKPDSGSIAVSPGHTRVGYLAQGFEPNPQQTLAELLHEIEGDPALLEERLAELGQAWANNPDDLALQVQYDQTLERLTRSGNGRLPALLETFQLSHLPHNQPIGTLSGGQKTRLALALLIHSEPELLLLDEPTNHLDIGMLEWLEEWLNTFGGGVLIVSHDRTFLDRTVTRILDLNPETHTLREYAGNYTDYLEQFLNEQEKLKAAYKDQVYEIQRMRQDIARTKEQARHVEITTTPRSPGVRRYAKKVAQKAASREKKLERYLADEDRVEKPKQGWQMKLDFLPPVHLGRDVLTLDNLAVGYAGLPPLLQNINASIGVGRRVVMTGPNGAGKTTLLRTIAGHLAPLAGGARLGASVKLGYMSQEQELLAPELTPTQTIQKARDLNETEARSFLHFFLFTGDDAVRPNKWLSFGERARLSLALLVAQGCTFLLLDEPINHLDIPSRTRFEAALHGFEGTILAVVHDRYFLDRFATDVWWVANGAVEVD